MPDTQNLRALVDELRRRELTLAAAESLTGGMFALLVVDEPGSGEVFVGSAVTYSSAAKRRVLGVSDCPVISARCATEMARGAAQLYGADVGVGLTGVAGPARQEDQPVGTVFVAGRVGAGGEAREACEEHHFGGSPNDIREASVDAAVALVRALLATGDSVSEGDGASAGAAAPGPDRSSAMRDADVANGEAPS